MNLNLGSPNSTISTEENEAEHTGPFPSTFLVIRLAPNIQPAAVTWFVKKITGKKQDGGAELLVRCEPFGGRQREVSLDPYKHITFLCICSFVVVLIALKRRKRASRLRTNYGTFSAVTNI